MFIKKYQIALDKDEILYKQAGNSIVVQVLEAIFRELLGVDVNENQSK